MNRRAAEKRIRRDARRAGLPRWEVLLLGSVPSQQQRLRRALRGVYGDDVCRVAGLLPPREAFAPPAGDEDQVELEDDELAPCCKCDCQGDGGISGGCLCVTCPQGCGACMCCCDCLGPYEL